MSIKHIFVLPWNTLAVAVSAVFIPIGFLILVVALRSFARPLNLLGYGFATAKTRYVHSTFTNPHFLGLERKAQLPSPPITDEDEMDDEEDWEPIVVREWSDDPNVDEEWSENLNVNEEDGRM